MFDFCRKNCMPFDCFLRDKYMEKYAEKNFVNESRPTRDYDTIVQAKPPTNVFKKCA